MVVIVVVKNVAVVMVVVENIVVEYFLDSQNFRSRKEDTVVMVVVVDDTPIVIDKLVRVTFAFQKEDTVARKNLSFVNLGKSIHVIMKEDMNDEEIRLNRDLLHERRGFVAVREAKYKTKMEQYHKKRARPVSFKVGELERTKQSPMENLGKLGPTWEGPYRVVEAYQYGSYRCVETKDTKDTPKLKQCKHLALEMSNGIKLVLMQQRKQCNYRSFNWK
ncbi:hypothetical protein Tco_1338406 [Tanacetum coccineum]